VIVSFAAPSTPELMINSSQDSLGPKTYRRHSSFQSLGLVRAAQNIGLICKAELSPISGYCAVCSSLVPLKISIVGVLH